MGKYNFDKVIDRKGTYASKWENMPGIEGTDGIPLWVADMDFQCSDAIVKALHERVDRQIFGYTLYDNDDLKNAVSGWYKKKYNWNVKHEDIFYSPGVVPAFTFLCLALTGEGDGIIIQPPVYHPFRMGIEATKREVVNNPLVFDKEKAYYTMDFEDLDKKFADPKNKGMILCHPHNPVGRIWTEEELKKVIAIAKKYGKWIISDEIHADIAPNSANVLPVVTYAGDYADEIMTLTAPSKAFNMAGLKMSNLVITKPEYQEKYLDMAQKQLHVLGVSPLAIAATIAAYTENDPWLEEVNDYIEANSKFVYDFFKKELPKSNPVKMESTYLAWVDLSAYASSTEELDEKIKKEARVALNNGIMFGEGGDGFQRINLACPRSLLEEGLKRIKEALV